MAINNSQLLKLKLAWKAIEEAKTAQDPRDVLWCIQCGLNYLNAAMGERFSVLCFLKSETQIILLLIGGTKHE